MIEALLAMKADLEMLKSAFGRSMKVGPVEEIDAERGYRLKLGEGENGPFLSPWYPHPESGGQSSSWMPLSKGQIVGVLNPSGDARQGVIFRGGFSGKDRPPSQDLSANVLKAFGIEIEMKKGICTITGDVVIDGSLTVSNGVSLSGGGTARGDFRLQGKLEVEGNKMTHNKKNVGSDHQHQGVQSGASNSGPPA